MFGDNCAPLPVKNTNYFTYRDSASAPTTQTLSLTLDTTNSIVAYCVQDNAGNINRGYYPNTLLGCFSSTNMSPIPTLSPETLSSHYAPLLRQNMLTNTSNL